MDRVVTAAIALIALVVSSTSATHSSHAVRTAHPTPNAQAPLRPIPSAPGSHCPAMPQVAPKGYVVSVSDDFTGTSLDESKWFRWAGEPGSDPYGWWSTSPRILTHSALDLQGRRVTRGGNPRWRHGGVVTRGVGSRHTQVFGEYQWCMRTDAMPGTSTIVLLWPKDDRWPPEIDFFESRGNTKWYTMTLHYESSHRHLEVHKNVVTEDAARWNVYTAVWRPREIQIREDGVIVSTIVSSHVPVIPMRLDFQTQAVKANARAGASDIGWVVEYARAG